MRHRVARHYLNRDTSHRLALLRNLATSLVEHESIRTTEAKARALRPYVEKLITLGKKGDHNSRRLAHAHIRTNEALEKLFSDIGPRFANRPGGYTRIIKLGFRPGDAAPVAIIELVEKSVPAAAPAAPADTAETPAI